MSFLLTLLLVSAAPAAPVAVMTAAPPAAVVAAEKPRKPKVRKICHTEADSTSRLGNRVCVVVGNDQAKSEQPRNSRVRTTAAEESESN